MIKLSKRLICCLLSFILCFGFAVGNAEETGTAAETITISSDVQEMMSALKLFGIIPEYYDYNVPVGAEITRADFAASVARLIGKNVYGGSNVYFYDVPKTHWAYNEISNLAEMGIINGSGNKMFRPDTTITKGEAYKILLSAMGYGLYAEHNGGFPTGYIKVANRIDLTNGVSGNENLIMSDMFYLIYNAMKTDVMEPVSYGSDDAVFEITEGVSVLSLYRDVYYAEGVVKGANTVTVDNGTIDKDDVLIDDVIYKSGDVLMADYIGQRVEFFYQQGNTQDDKTVLWVVGDDTDDVLNIEADNSASFDKKTFVYTYYDKDDTKKTINLDRGITLIYNGGIVESDFDEILNKGKYSLRLVKNNGKYTVAVVKEYKNYVAGSINTTEYKIYDKIVPQSSIVLREDLYDTFSLKMYGGSDMNFDEIKKGSVLSIYESKDKKHLEVVVCNNMVTGTVNEIKADGDYYIIKLSGTEYRMNKSVDDGTLALGNEIKAYLDAYGSIAYIENAESRFEGAFIIDLSLQENGLTSSLGIKYLAQDGNITVAKCADKAIIDGKRFDDATDIETALLAGENEFASQFALIKKNSDNEIREIDTVILNPEYETTDSLAIDVPFINEGETEMKKRQVRATAAAARIGEKIIFDTDSIVFSIPVTEDYKTADEDEFAVLPGTGMVNDTGVYAQSYKTTEDGGVSKYLLVQGYSSKSTAYENPIVVSNIGTGMAEDGTIVEVLNGYQGSTFVSINASSNKSDLFSQSGALPGTLVRIGKNNKGNVNECAILYDYRKGEENKNTALNDIYGVFSGYVNNIVDDVVKIGFKSGDAFDYAIRVGSSPVVIYDTTATRNPIYTGSIGDAVTYKNNPAECSKIVIITSRMQGRMFLIYK